MSNLLKWVLGKLTHLLLKIKMIPFGEMFCTELNIDGNSFIICLIAESSPEQITVYMTDCDEFLIGCITLEKLTLIETNLKTITKDRRNNLFRNAVNNKKVTFSEANMHLNFVVSNGDIHESLTVPMNKVDPENTKAYIKALFFQVVRETNGFQEKVSPERPLSSTFIQKRSYSKHTKHKLQGTSIVNPHMKKIYYSSGVQFEDD